MGFLVSAEQVAVMFVIILIGWIAYRAKLVGEDAVSGMTNILLYAVNPCLIINAFQIDFEAERLSQLALAFAVDCSLMLISLPLVKLFLPKRLVPDLTERRVLRFGTIYTNLGFYGIPIVNALIGKEGVLYMVAFILAFTLFNWTHGITMFAAQGKLKGRIIKIITNPNIIGSVVAVLLFVCSIRLPDVLGRALEMAASLNTPLSMIVIGCNVAVISLRSMFKEPRVWYATLLRNLVMPLISLGILTLLPIPDVPRTVALVAMACPVGVTVVMFSVRHKTDTRVATRFICISTLTSILTLPAILALAGMLWG